MFYFLKLHYQIKFRNLQKQGNWETTGTFPLFPPWTLWPSHNYLRSPRKSGNRQLNKRKLSKIGPRWVHMFCFLCVTRASVIKAVAKRTCISREIRLINSVKLVGALAKCQRARNKHENKLKKSCAKSKNRRFHFIFWKNFTFPFHCEKIMVTFRRRRVLFWYR